MSKWTFIGITIALLASIPTSIFASQWEEASWVADLSTTANDWTGSFHDNGDGYTIIAGVAQYAPYTSNYHWGPLQPCNTPDTISGIAVHPNQSNGQALVIDGNGDIRWATIAGNKTTLTWGSVLGSLSRSGHYPIFISWTPLVSGSRIYIVFEDWRLFYSDEPYSSLQEITGLGSMTAFSARKSGDYAIISTGGNSLYETSYDNGWEPREEITEITLGTTKDKAILACFTQEHENSLFYMSPGPYGGGDIALAKGDDTSAIESSSIGRIKALYR